MSTQDDRCPWCGSPVSRAKFEEITARIREQEQLKLAEREKEIRKEFEVQLDRERKKAAQAQKEQSRKEMEGLRAKVTKLEASETKLRKELKEQMEKETKEQLEEQRTILNAQHEKDLAKKDSEHKRAMEKMQTEIKELGRRLEKKTANDLGDAPEVDLFETLKGEFPEDYVVRVKRGEAGADIHQTVKHRGEKCGLMVFDSKNRMQWKYEFAKKLRQDQMAAEAEYAILATSAFPTGKKELCMEENVIVVNPVRVIHIARILRDAMIKLHMQGLGIKERKTKIEQIYRFITSDEYSQKFAEAGRLTDAILNVEVKEKKEHDKTWRERGMLLTNLKKVLREIDDDVYTILGGKGSEAFDERELVQEERVPL